MPNHYRPRHAKHSNLFHKLMRQTHEPKHTTENHPGFADVPRWDSEKVPQKAIPNSGEPWYLTHPYPETLSRGLWQARRYPERGWK